MSADYKCECCGKDLAWGNVDWLELDQRIDSFHDYEISIPEGQSQGAFPFGPDCARRACKQAKEAATSAGIFLGRKRIGKFAKSLRRINARRQDELRKASH